MDRWKFVNEKWIPRTVSRGEGYVLGTAVLSYRSLPIGEGFVSGIAASPSNLRPFGAPPSIGRRKCPREPLPLEGAAERSEAGLASFFAGKPPPLCFPHGERLCPSVLFFHICVYLY